MKKKFCKELGEPETLERLKIKIETENLKKVNKIEENKKVIGEQE